jgi:hypothetical protein
MESIYIAVTAHDPLSRVESTLAVLRGYETLPLDVYVEFFIDHGHKCDVDEFSLIVKGHSHLKQVNFNVASSEYTGFSLCWAHKKHLTNRVLSRAHDYYMYSENDMLFGSDQFNYWHFYKDKLKKLNLEPGFCRYEEYRGLEIPFDNYKKWNLNGLTPNVWGDLPYECGVILTPKDPNFIGFTSLGNPYAGLMILDQEDAEKYISSQSCHPTLSHAKTGKRNWPIADRSSMGLAFEYLKSDQEHRRVVPIASCGDSVEIHSCCLVKHLDVKYSPSIYEESDTICTGTMFKTDGSC